MKRIVRSFGAIVLRAPAAVVVATLVAAGVLGSFAGQVVIATGNEGFAPDNPEIAASGRINEYFGGNQEVVFQVIVRQPEGDVISADGLAASLAVEEAIRSVAGDDLADTVQRPGVVTFMAPVLEGAAMEGSSLAEVSDADVDRLYTSTLEGMAPEQVGFVAGLLSSEGDANTATSPAAMILAFFASDTVDANEAFEEQLVRDEDLAEALAAIDTDLEIRPFSFSLLFGAVDSFTEEVGRLFAYAGVIIVVILLFVYWMRARGSATVVQTTRRTIADMLLTMVTILLAIGMMQGTGVLLERVGIISAFSAPTQIVPILIIGLGVDYAIHLTSRYREEIGERLSVDESMTTAVSTVGVALVLATLTTVIGFLTNIANPVPALADFGILAAVGIFFSFLLMMTFVPAVRLILDRRAERKGRLPVEACQSHSKRVLPQLMGRTAVIADRVPVLAVGIALVLGGLGFYGFTQLETRFSFTDFLPEDAPAVETLEILTDDFGGGFGEQTQALVEAPDGATLTGAAVHNAMVEALDEMAELDTVSVFNTPVGPVANASSPIGVIRQLLGTEGLEPPPGVVEALGAVQAADDLTVPEGADVGPLYAAAAEAAPELWETVSHYVGR
ncbi:hypothetical protein BH23ACT5_BH23ACT5_05230 [soil metagenome]